MNKFALTLSAYLFLGGLAAQNSFTTNSSTNLDSLLNVVFRNESCFDLLPDTLVGGDNVLNDGRRVTQTGTFTGGMPHFNMEDGIILTTGFVQSAPGPNNAFFSASGTFPGNTRMDLDAAALVGPGQAYFDVAYLEFTFIPTTDTISFDYVFFSEEYCFAIDAVFGNDAFGFFLEGPGVMPNGRRNIARLPNGNVVSARTLNHLATPSLFVDNNPPGSFDPCTGMPAPADQLAAINYDGFSVKLTAKAAVTPCEVHKLKLIVVDSGDPVFDSGILLEAGSFTAGLIADPLPSVRGIAGNVSPVEGCDTAFITFNRLFTDPTDLNAPLEVNYNLITTGLGGLNLADNGLDFDLPPPPFVIPPGDTTATLAIPINSDALNNEGVEAFVLRYDGTCNCDANRDTFFIQDAVPLQVDIQGPLGACAGATVDLTAVPAGGNGDYSYQWPSGETSPNVSFVATGRDTTIDVLVSDGCGLEGTGTFTLTAADLSASTAGAFNLCATSSVDVPLDVDGGGPYNVELEITRGGMTTISTVRVLQDTFFTFVGAGNLRVLGVTDDAGCGGIASGTATVTEDGVSLTATVDQPRCDGDNGQIILMGTGGNNNYDFSWDDAPGNDAPIRLSLPPGTYTANVNLRAEPSCAQSFTYTIADPGPPVIDSIAFSRPACPGTPATLIPYLSGGRAPFSFLWVNQGVTDSLLDITTQNGSTTYFLIVEDDCGQEVSSSVTIDYPSFNLDVGGRYSLCDQPAPINVPYTISGPEPSYTLTFDYTVNGVTTTRTETVPTGSGFVPLPSPGTAVFTGIQNTAGCPGDVIGGTVTIVDPQIRFDALVTDARCNGQPGGSIELRGVATVPVTYAWSDGGPATATRNGLAPGDYTVTITDADDPGCFRDSTITISEPAPLSVAAEILGVQACPGESQTLIAEVSGGTGPYTYAWSDGTTTEAELTFTVQPGPNDYAVTVTDDCGVAVTAAYNDLQPDVQAAIGGTFSICNAPFEADVPLTVSGATRYLVTIRENGIDRSFTVTQDTSLTYVEATEIALVSVIADGCPGRVTGSASVTDASFFVDATVRNVDCRGEATGTIALTVNADNSRYDFSWDRAGLAGPNLTDLPAGNYGLTITERGPDACQFDTSFVITEPASALGFVSDERVDATCEEPSRLRVDYAGGTAPLTYQWSNGATGPTIVDVPGGDYTVSVTDANGCELTQTLSVQDLRTNVTAEISSSATELSCTQPAVTLTAAGNAFPVTYAWTNEAGMPVGDGRTLNVSTPGEYTVIVTDPANACSDTDTFVLGQSDDLIALTLPAQYRVTCLFSTVDPTVSHPDYTDPVRYEWLRDGVVVGSDAVLTDQFRAGTYEVQVTRLDNGCTTTAMTEIVEDNTPPMIAVPTEPVILTCRTDSLGLTVTAASGNRFAWATADGNIVANEDSATVFVDRPGTYNVAVTNPDNGCVSTAPVVVELDGETVTPDAGPDQILVCNGPGTILRASTREGLPGTTYRWLDPDGELIGTTQRVRATQAGDYTLEAIHPQTGCGSFDEVTVISEAPTDADIVIQQAPCEEVGGRIFVIGVTGRNPPFTFSSPSGTVESNPRVLGGFPTGVNTLIVTDVNGCTYEEDFTIFEPDEFSGRATDVEVVLGEEAVLGVRTNRPDGEPIRHRWSNLPDTNACINCPSPSFFPTESFTAQVDLIDSSGCPLTLRQSVIVSERELVYLPNAFSPGRADGVNDVFTVFGDADFVASVERMHVYDRWGTRVFDLRDFSINDPRVGWDGTNAAGREYPAGVYVYVVEVRYADGGRDILKGDFVLIR